MGIPSYFSHIIKEHRKIIKQISSNTSEITEYLFLDSNSIIYDVIRSLDYDEKDIDFEKNAIHEICKQIKYYIQLIKPTQKTMIAFDGVAPVAKLKQQQSRRYKNAYIKNKFPKKKTRMEYIGYNTWNRVYAEIIARSNHIFLARQNVSYCFDK